MGNNRKNKKNRKNGTGGGRGQEEGGSDSEEARILLQLQQKTRALLASLKGVTPDGLAFTTANHPLATLYEDIWDLTDQLMKRQSVVLKRFRQDKDRGDGTSSSSSRDQDHRVGRDNAEVWHNFQRWLQSCQIDPSTQNSPLEIRAGGTGGGYGLFATRDIQYEETILQVPVEAMMSPFWDHCLVPQTASPPKPPPFLQAQTQPQMKPLSLLTYLANERYRGSKSPYASYIETLPQTYNTPLYWSSQVIKRSSLGNHTKRAVMIQTLTMWEYLQMRNLIQEHHANHATDSAEIIPLQEFTYELFRWAAATAHTRQNKIPFFNTVKNNNIDSALGLVPLWDLLNHEDADRACRTEVVFHEEIDVKDGETPSNKKQGVLICKTPSMPLNTNHPSTNKNQEYDKQNPICFSAGEEVTMYYGDRSNAQLLFHSGFVNCQYEPQKYSTQNGVKCQNNECVNLNRNDVATLRLALPPAADDDGLDRVREMIAARFEFTAYVDQSCEHDGVVASTAVSQLKEASVKKNRSDGERDNGAVVMTEISLSPILDEKAFLPSSDLVRSLILIMADKEELTSLLRNMDHYIKPKTGIDNCALLQLGNKHLQLVSRLVQLKNAEYEVRKKEYIDATAASSSLKLREEKQKEMSASKWIENDIAERLSFELLTCDNITLNAWFRSFRSKIENQEAL
mmetsp:Transcript_7222/g.10542  ORF Transcript_7222/g.10542 Transcript_7222/m.10542 type:complete len:682 (-) Transcript_7222:426-2471(-)|eukprot:CAMPEP_0195509224 /NCGR_PEP_ID=MMETSP0794_2-20130614/2221_1 /TAXON_ID=515487 /ORGANISM="Stephanopyxis turris, Strain CCMP 815" /LENGTH=681 /DNA_ID=CAMNT_0040636389 /DNA_START=45 /DNA_END=2090 /DNA_ORIENTATION=-